MISLKRLHSNMRVAQSLTNSCCWVKILVWRYVQYCCWCATIYSWISIESKAIATIQGKLTISSIRRSIYKSTFHVLLFSLQLVAQRLRDRLHITVTDVFQHSWVLITNTSCLIKRYGWEVLLNREKVLLYAAPR